MLKFNPRKRAPIRTVRGGKEGGEVLAVKPEAPASSQPVRTLSSREDANPAVRLSGRGRDLTAVRAHRQVVITKRTHVPRRTAGPARTRARRFVRRPTADNRYVLKQSLGKGGGGTVYLAEDRLLNLRVAIKVLDPVIERHPATVAALMHEARITMGLTHNHIVRLHNLERVKGKYYLVMEYVPGHSLRKILRQYGPMSLDNVVTVVEVCADALSYAHGMGVIHRDLKPGNLLLSDGGVLKVIDFGIASLIDRSAEDGVILGTPCYMSPEQLRGDTVDVRTDVYALAQVVYELLVGRPRLPYEVSADEALAQARSPVTGLPDEMAAVIGKAEAWDPDDRWPTIGAFAEAFVRAADEYMARVRG